MAAVLIVAFDADVTRLIQLYILGVFLSFTLSQAGMVRHWARELADAPPTRAIAAQAVNATGAVRDRRGPRDRADDEVRAAAPGSSC